MQSHPHATHPMSLSTMIESFVKVLTDCSVSAKRRGSQRSCLRWLVPTRVGCVGVTSGRARNLNQGSQIPMTRSCTSASGKTSRPFGRLSFPRRTSMRDPNAVVRCRNENSTPLRSSDTRTAQDAVRGTYWWELEDSTQPVTVTFDTADGDVVAEAKEGENVLRLAQKYNAVKSDPDFCYEGTCELCVMEIEGAAEVGRRRDPEAGEFVRTCITPVPARDSVKVKVQSDDDLWSESFV